jgi:hypothetical protein
MAVKQRSKSPTALTLRLAPHLGAKVARACQATGLKRTELIRLALDRGIDRLLEQLTSTPTA